MERITADMIAEKEFTIESRGYNKDEVDTFLDLICEEMDRLNNEIQDLRQKTTIVRPSAPAPENTGGGSMGLAVTVAFVDGRMTPRPPPSRTGSLGWSVAR